MKFEVSQYASGIRELTLIHSEGIGSEFWKNLQSSYQNISPTFDLSVNLPLGKQAERYVSQMIHSSNQYELILENYQVIADKRTIGELDYIILDKYQKIYIHIELATKFYLKRREQWVGPNLKDRLDLKIEKYHTHQKNLIEDYSVKQKLEELSVLKVHSQLLIIGQLYKQYEVSDTFDIFDLNQTYISYTTFCQLSFTKDVSFNIPTKKDWIVNPLENNIWFSKEEVDVELEDLIKAERSPMLWMRDSSDRYIRSFITWW